MASYRIGVIGAFTSNQIMLQTASSKTLDDWLQIWQDAAPNCHRSGIPTSRRGDCQIRKYPRTINEIYINIMTYLYLALAITFEVIATSALKASAEFTRVIPSLIVVVGYGLAFYLLSLVLRTMPVGIAYALWCGLGVVLVSLVSMVVYKQSLDMPAVIGMAVIVLGVVIINVFSKTVSH